MDEKNIKIGDDFANLSVLDAVRRAMPDLGAREVFKKARTGEILLNKKRCIPQDRLTFGDILTILLPKPPKPSTMLAEKENLYVTTPVGPFVIAREDEDVLAVVKPSGCPSHPALGRSGDTLIERVKAYLGDRGGFSAALANRLDIDTSGIVLIGKNEKARSRLGFMVQRGQIQKYYLALVGGITPEEGDITRPLFKRADSRDAGHFPDDHPRATGRLQEAHTRFRTVYSASSILRASLVEVELLTGRTHQIRRHFADEGHPVAGDRRYGDRDFNHILNEDLGLDRIFLHAHAVMLKHPRSGENLRIFAEPPSDLAQAVKALGGDLVTLYKEIKARHS